MSNPYTEGYFERGEGSNYYNYGDDPGWTPTARILRKFIPPEITHPYLLELGAAKGFFMHHAHVVGFNVRGIDISEHATSHPASEWVKQYLHLGDASEPLPFDQTFDVVCSWEFLEHIPKDDMMYVLYNPVLKLKPGGLFVHRIALKGMDGDSDATHVSMHNRDVWENVFDFMGLEHRPDIEEAFDQEFKDRDWAGRFFAWQRPLP